jgi:hypothetical protein
MSVRRIAVVALAIFAVSATVAIAAESGPYRGHTQGLYFSSAGEGHYRQAKIAFNVVGGNHITNLRWEIRVECADDTHKSYVIKPSGFLTLNEDGKFAGRVATPGGTGFDRISGRIRGDRASGAVSRTIKLGAGGTESAGGQSCSSGRVEYKAHEIDPQGE